MSKQMAVQDDVVAIVEKYAKQAGIENSASLDRFVRMGISRHNALARYAGSETKAPAKKAPAKKAAAKAPAKKAAKK